MQISERSYGMKGVGPFYVLERHFLRVSFCLSKQPFLKASYLETLSVGKQTPAIVSETETAATEFTVKAAASDDTQPPQTGNNQTGDSHNSGTSTGIPFPRRRETAAMWCCGFPCCLRREPDCWEQPYTAERKNIISNL